MKTVTDCMRHSESIQNQEKNHPGLVLVEAHLCLWVKVGLSVQDGEDGQYRVKRAGRRSRGKGEGERVRKQN